MAAYPYTDTTLPEYPDYSSNATPPLTMAMLSQLGNNGVNMTMDAGPSTPAPTTPPSTTPQRVQRTEDVAQGAQPGNTMPTILAVLAALSGNFGPAMQLEEQKRKTALYKQLEAPTQQINHHINQGEYDKAIELSNKMVMSVGDRAPEVLPYLKSEHERIAGMQQGYNALKGTYTYLKSIIPDDDEGSLKKLGAVSHLLNNHSAVSMDLAKTIINNLMQKHEQMIDHQYLIGDALTGTLKAIPLKSVFEQPKGYVAEQIQADFPGLTLSNLENIMRDRPFEYQGEMHQPSPLLRESIGKRLGQLQGVQAQLTVGAGIPKEAAATTQLQQQGVPALNIATGNITPQQAGGVLSGIEAQAKRVAEAGPLAQVNMNPYGAEQAGLGHIDLDAGNFGAQVHGITAAQALASGGRYVPLPQRLIDERVQPSIRALNDLKQSDQMFNLLGLEDMASPLDRIQTGLRRKISQYTGLPLKEGDTGAVAIQALMNRGIEQLAESKAIPESAIGQLKKMSAGIGAQPETAREMLQVFQQKVQRDLSLYMDQNKVQSAFAPSGAQQGVGKGNTSQHEGLWLPMAQRLGVEPALVRAILGNEGSGDTDVSRSGAIGRFQLMPDTAAPYLKALGKTQADLLDPTVNAQVGLLHLATLKGNHPTWTTPHLLAAYIGGEGAVNGDGSINARRREPPTASGTPGNTVGNYVKTGMERYNAGKPKVTFTPSGGR